MKGLKAKSKIFQFAFLTINLQERVPSLDTDFRIQILLEVVSHMIL